MSFNLESPDTSLLLCVLVLMATTARARPCGYVSYTGVAKNSALICVDQSMSYWVRSICNGGFLTMRSQSVIMDTSLSRHDARVQLVKEACIVRGHNEHIDTNKGVVLTRLTSLHSSHYICLLNPCGHSVPVTRQRAHHLGLRCAFAERPIPGQPAFVHFQSAYHPNWYLGERTLSCARTFATGEFSPKPHWFSTTNWDGLFGHIQMYRAEEANNLSRLKQKIQVKN